MTPALPRPPASIAAGHPATAAAGHAVLTAGGSAADAAIAAVLASCVAETIFTGLGGGGFATYWSAAEQTVTCLDFFTAAPGLGSSAVPAPMSRLHIKFGDVDLDFSVGASSVAVPGVPAGCGELYRRWATLPWDQLVAPAMGLSRAGVPLSTAHQRILTRVTSGMLLGEGRLAYAPAGTLLAAGEKVRHPGLDRTMEILAVDGPDVFYRGKLAETMVTTVNSGGGVLNQEDLAAYRVIEVPAARAQLGGRYTVWGRVDLNHTVDAFTALPADFETLTEPERTVAFARTLGGPDSPGDTTNITVVDSAGNACVVTTSLGLGAGVWLPGYGVHLNSMLGEGELIRGELRPGKRVGSMMCPLVVTEDDEDGPKLVLGAGAAGASRIRSGLLQTVTGVLLEEIPPKEAVARPRVHPVGSVAHLEVGHPDGTVEALTAAGYQVELWPEPDHYFGGVSMVAPGGPAADPRRDGATLTV